MDIWSLNNFKEDLNNYLDSGMFGIDDFGRKMIIFIFIFFTVGILSFKYGFTSPLAVTTSIFLLLFFFDVVLELIPEISPFGIVIPNILTMLTGIILILLILKEASR